jgi:glycosyltransferase involved in cell wall biosynthesis
VLANIERSRLKELYGQASIFWHAAGYGEGDGRPELSEHFGIATVEAMSAGCVPIVINKGGQPEIVEHGVSGFLWSKLEELKEYTELAVKDEQLRAQMAEAARARAALFSREQFVSRFLSLIGESD